MCDFVKVFSGSLKKTSFSLTYILYFAFFAGNAVNNVLTFAVYIIFAYVGSFCVFTGDSARFVNVLTVSAVGFLTSNFCLIFQIWGVCYLIYLRELSSSQDIFEVFVSSVSKYDFMVI